MLELKSVRRSNKKAGDGAGLRDDSESKISW
jgi:hypothetical protein